MCLGRKFHSQKSLRTNIRQFDEIFGKQRKFLSKILFSKLDGNDFSGSLLSVSVMFSFLIKPSNKQKTHSFNSFVKPIVVRFILYCTVNVDLTEFSHCQRHTVWKLQKYTLIEEKFRQINYLVISLFSKTVTFTKFLQRKSESIFL